MEFLFEFHSKNYFKLLLVNEYSSYFKHFYCYLNSWNLLSASGEGDAAQRVGAEVSGRQAGAGQCLPCRGAGEKQEGACSGKKHYQHNCYFTVTVMVREKHSQI